MADTIREQIIAAVALRMGAQRTVPTFNEGTFTVTGANGRAVWSPEAEVTAAPEYGLQPCTMTITIIDFDKVPRGQLVDKQAKLMIGNVIKEATGSDVTLGGLARSLRYVSDSTLYPAADSQFVGVEVVFSCEFHFKLGDPFTQTP